MAEGGEKRSPTAHRTPSQEKRYTRTYRATPEQKKNRAARGRARTKLKKEGVNVAGKDVAHKKSLMKGGTNARSNLTVQSVKKNRGWERKKK